MKWQDAMQFVVMVLLGAAIPLSWHLGLWTALPTTLNFELGTWNQSLSTIHCPLTTSFNRLIYNTDENKFCHIPKKCYFCTRFPSYESWNLSLEFQFSFFNSHFSILIVPWCNGSTSDFGSACPGSSPGGTTKNASPEAFFLYP